VDQDQGEDGQTRWPCPIVDELLACGVTPAAARKLAKFDHARIHHQIANLRDRQRRGKQRIANPGGWLANAIRERYRCAERVLRSAERVSSVSDRLLMSMKREREREAEREREKDKKADEILLQLSPGKRAELVKAALKAAGPMGGYLDPLGSIFQSLLRDEALKLAKAKEEARIETRKRLLPRLGLTSRAS